ncbi:glycodelin isoform X2 [Homo sapiens]|uniref:glycodelin isoform X2 n=1 Tax=Homo sapiens TaxID=9606 RepID=UPI0005CFFCA6|nr:glycodelin isoform X2 [Homo sapiens]|eukprot:XP_011517050.1 glycodelin isoform X2 [Homo sapiens]
MLCLLLTLGVALVCGVPAMDIPQTKQDLELPKAPLRVHITSLLPTPEDNLEIVLHRWENNSCVEKKVLGEKTENPKKFKINYTVANEATLLDTDYDNFLFLCLQDTTTPIQSMMCQYLGKASGAPQLSWKPQGPRTDPASSTARVLVEDDEIMQGFIRAFRPLPRHLWYLLDLKQMEEPCRF